MGCPLCDWKTALLLIVGLMVLLLPLGVFSNAGFGLIIVAYVWTLWPKKSCRIDDSKP